MCRFKKLVLIYTILFQRYRKDDQESNSDDDYVPYVPVRERKKQELLKLGRLSKVINVYFYVTLNIFNRPLNDFIIFKLNEESKKKLASNDEFDEDETEGQAWGRKSNISLLDQHTELKKLAEGKIKLFLLHVL